MRYYELYDSSHYDELRKKDLTSLELINLSDCANLYRTFNFNEYCVKNNIASYPDPRIEKLSNKFKYSIGIDIFYHDDIYSENTIKLFTNLLNENCTKWFSMRYTDSSGKFIVKFYEETDFILAKLSNFYGVLPKEDIFNPND